MLRNRISLILFLLLSVVLFGVVGYVYIEELSFINALYMTIITITTVGYGEVGHPFSEEGRLFTIFLILSGYGLFIYSITMVVEEFLSGNFIRQYKNRKMENQLIGLSGHVIICGYGRNGIQAEKTLLRYNKPIVVIENDQSIINENQGTSSTFFLNGDASDDVILLKAGIESALAIITALPSDPDNLYVVLTARQLCQKIKIISRASEMNSIKKLKIAGADNVIMPDAIGGQHMASLVMSPDIIEFLETITINDKENINLIEICTDLFMDKFKSLGDLEIKKKTGCTVIGLKDESGFYTVNPDDDTLLIPSNYMIVLGRKEQLDSLKSLYDLDY